MTFKIRKLSKTGKSNRVGMTEQGVFAVMALDGGVFDVNTSEMTLTSSQVEQLVDARELATTDLVQVDGCWMTLADSPWFAEVAAPHARREARWRWLKGAALVALALAFVAFKFWVRSR